YGVLMYVQFVFAAIFIGYSMGSAPVISYHFGAGSSGELKSLLKKSNVLMFAAGAAMAVSAQILASPLAKLFVGYNPELLDMTVRALRISTVSFVIVGFNVFASSFFTALNDGGVSAAISFLRTFIFKMAAIMLLPLLFKLDGIWLADVTAEIFSFAISLIFLFAKKNKYRYM
ncbi:MAG: MATE family efflux transporter, partial [Prevotella sp.]|nr:MATE family efflux transporter [Prevotella sp.]